MNSGPSIPKPAITSALAEGCVRLDGGAYAPVDNLHKMSFLEQSFVEPLLS
jgi:hypothetical protein